jgi:hypothetical protein
MPDPVRSSARACDRFNCASSYPCSWSITGMLHVAGIGAMIHITAQMPVLVAIRVGQWKKICALHEYRLYRVEELTVSCKKSKRDRSFPQEHGFRSVLGARSCACFATMPLLIFKGLQSGDWANPVFKVETMPSSVGQTNSEEEVPSWPNTVKRAFHRSALTSAFCCAQSTVEKVLNGCGKASRNLLHWHSLEGFSRSITRVHFGFLLIALGKG